MPPIYFERILFVVGEQNSGKSTQLRNIFRDVRLGTFGKIPKSKKISETHRLSNERNLYLRLTSPNEYGESPIEFLNKVREKATHFQRQRGSRWNLASALQPHPYKKMPNAVETCEFVLKQLNPERIRLCFLVPEKVGESLNLPHAELVSQLLSLPKTEVCWIDAGRKQQNGLFLADFFYFA